MEQTKMLKRIASIVLSCVLVLTLVPAFGLEVCADTEDSFIDDSDYSDDQDSLIEESDYNGYYALVDNLYYELNESNNTATLTGAKKKEGNLNIPSSIDYNGKKYEVTTIGDSAFYYCDGFKGNLTIPNSVTTIGNYAFCGCRGFDSEIKLGKSVKKIGINAFGSCSGLKGDLKLPNSVSKIEDDAFNNCYNLNGTLTIPKSVKKIKTNAFNGCLFKKINNKSKCKFDFMYGLPSNLTIMGVNGSGMPSTLSASRFYFYYADKKGRPCFKDIVMYRVSQGVVTKEKVVFKSNYGKGPYVLRVNKKIDNDISTVYKKVEISKDESSQFLPGQCPFGDVTFKKLSGNENISISKYGKVTVKNLKPGTYKVKVKMTSLKNIAYKSCKKTVTFKVIVK